MQVQGRFKTLAHNESERWESFCSGPHHPPVLLRMDSSRSPVGAASGAQAKSPSTLQND